MLSGTLLTVGAVPNNAIQRAHEIGKDSVDVVEPGQQVDDVGAWVRILLGQQAGEENGQGLRPGTPSARPRWQRADETHVQGMIRREAVARLDRLNGPAEELSGAALEQNGMGGVDVVEHPRQGRAVRPQEEEFPPEAFRLFSIVVLECRLGSADMPPFAMAEGAYLERLPRQPISYLKLSIDAPRRGAGGEGRGGQP